MMKLASALALLFALHSGGGDASASPRELSSDGINPRAGRAQAAQRKPRPATRQQSKRAPVAKSKPGGANESKPGRANEAAHALVPVTELDADGLKKLLQRGDSQRAARPLLLNFWATWCVPCRKEFPDLVKLDADYRGRELEFALVSADDVSELKTSVPQFLREMRAAAIPAYLLNAEDTQAAIAQVDPQWGGELPATFLFDRQGKLAYRHFGIIKPAELREAIDKVMSDK